MKKPDAETAITTVMLPERVDSATSASVEAMMIDALRPGARVVVDGSAVTYMSARKPLASVGRPFARTRCGQSSFIAPLNCRFASFSAPSAGPPPIACWSADLPSFSMWPSRPSKLSRDWRQSVPSGQRTACTGMGPQANYMVG